MSNERRNEDVEGSSTEPFFGNPAGLLPAAPAGVSILFFHRGGVEPAQLAPGQSLIAGRHAPSDVRIPDSMVSGKHARFTLQEGHVLVEDLGSRNGTWIEGKRIEKAAISRSGEAMLGTVIARVIALEPAAPSAVDCEEEFSLALDAELARAQHHRRSFAVLALRATDAEAARGQHGSWAMQLRGGLRPFQRVRLHRPDTALILLPEATRDEALTVARTLASGSGAAGSSRRVGVAVYPDDATSAHKLLDEAREAVRRASPERTVVSATTVRGGEGDVRADDAPIVGTAQRKLFDDAKRVAPSRIPVLVQGETGTGKEVVARYVHDHGPRRSKPCIAVNCALWTDSLLESRLFGHEKGAFTGAAQTRKGVFEEADGGTLFLDEIGELKPEAQAALLRVLEARTITRIGSTQEIKVDVRIIAATHRDLERMVREQRFREDLYYRLSTLVLTVPPLRDRCDEIKLFVERFVRHANEEHGRTGEDGNRRVLGVSPEAIALLHAYHWHGNVRELRNVVERAVALAQGDMIQPDDLPSRLHAVRPATEPSAGATNVAAEVPRRADAKDPSVPVGLKAERLAAEARKIEEALRQSNGNQENAAKILGISSRTLRRRIKELGIQGGTR